MKATTKKLLIEALKSVIKELNYAQTNIDDCPIKTCKEIFDSEFEHTDSHISNAIEDLENIIKELENITKEYEDER